MRLFIPKPLIEKTVSGIKKHHIVLDNAQVWKRNNPISFYNNWHRSKLEKPERIGFGICEDAHTLIIDPAKDYVKVNGDYYANAELLNEFAQAEGYESWQKLKYIYPKYFKGKLITWNYFKCEFLV
jgi:hypothetical protein